MTPPTDRALLIEAAAGRESAFAALYGRYTDPLRCYFVGQLGGNLAADDLVQQVFVQLLDSRAFRQPHGGPEKLDKLLFTIARNLVRNEVRGDRRRGKRETAFHQRQGSEEPETAPDTTALHGALRQLPDHQRQSLLLRFRHGMDVKAIADLMDCAPGTVKSRLHYGLKRLAHLLQPLGKADDQTKP